METFQSMYTHKAYRKKTNLQDVYRIVRKGNLLKLFNNCKETAYKKINLDILIFFFRK